MEYVVDTTKPPIGPPNRIFKERLFMLIETRESIDQHKAYQDYIERYNKSFERTREKGTYVYVDWPRTVKEPAMTFVETDKDGWEIVSRKIVRCISFDHKERFTILRFSNGTNMKIERSKINDLPDMNNLVYLVEKRKKFPEALCSELKVASSLFGEFYTKTNIEEIIETDEFGWEITSRETLTISTITYDVSNKEYVALYKDNCVRSKRKNILNFVEKPNLEVEFYGILDPRGSMKVVVARKRLLRDPKGRWEEEQYHIKYEIEEFIYEK